MLDLPCVECCSMDLTCCKNPQILWNMEEVDSLFTMHGPDSEIMQNLTITKGEQEGTVYLMRINPDDISGNSIVVDYCAMYDQDNRRCSVYNERPVVCKTYGDPKYATCPYTDYRKEGALVDLVKNNKELSERLHTIVPSNPVNLYQDYFKPWGERFQESKKTNPEWFEWWEKLPTANFVRK